MAGINETEALTVGATEERWGFLARHYSGVSEHVENRLAPCFFTFTASIHSLRSPSESDLNSRLTRGFSQVPLVSEAAYAVVKNVKRRAK